jgi:hypothetical protein
MLRLPEYGLTVKYLREESSGRLEAEAWKSKIMRNLKEEQ